MEVILLERVAKLGAMGEIVRVRDGLARNFLLPQGKALIPGVIDSTCNYIEHPELIAQRIVRFAEAVGRENVIAGSDCGFGTFAALPLIYPRIAWAKLRALAEGAELATRALWR